MYTCQSSSKNKAFRALVLPILDYATVVWKPHVMLLTLIYVFSVVILIIRVNHVIDTESAA